MSDTLLIVLAAAAAGFAAGAAVVATWTRRRERILAAADQRERCVAFLAAMDRWIGGLDVATTSSRGDAVVLEAHCDEAHLSFARLELVVPERVALAGRLWLAETAFAYRSVADRIAADGIARDPALRRLVDRAAAGRHDFAALVRAELGAASDLSTPLLAAVA